MVHGHWPGRGPRGRRLSPHALRLFRMRARQCGWRTGTGHDGASPRRCGTPERLWPAWSAQRARRRRSVDPGGTTRTPPEWHVVEQRFSIAREVWTPGDLVLQRQSDHQPRVRRGEASRCASVFVDVQHGIDGLQEHGGDRHMSARPILHKRCHASVSRALAPSTKTGTATSTRTCTRRLLRPASPSCPSLTGPSQSRSQAASQVQDDDDPAQHGGDPHRHSGRSKAAQERGRDAARRRQELLGSACRGQPRTSFPGCVNDPVTQGGMADEWHRSAGQPS